MTDGRASGLRFPRPARFRGSSLDGSRAGAPGGPALFVAALGRVCSLSRPGVVWRMRAPRMRSGPPSLEGPLQTCPARLVVAGGKGAGPRILLGPNRALFRVPAAPGGDSSPICGGVRRRGRRSGRPRPPTQGARTPTGSVAAPPRALTMNEAAGPVIGMNGEGLSRSPWVRAPRPGVSGTRRPQGHPWPRIPYNGCADPRFAPPSRNGGPGSPPS